MNGTAVLVIDERHSPFVPNLSDKASNLFLVVSLYQEIAFPGKTVPNFNTVSSHHSFLSLTLFRTSRANLRYYFGGAMTGRPLTAFLLTALALYGIYIYRQKKGLQ